MNVGLFLLKRNSLVVCVLLIPNKNEKKTFKRTIIGYVIIAPYMYMYMYKCKLTICYIDLCDVNRQSWLGTLVIFFIIDIS